MSGRRPRAASKRTGASGKGEVRKDTSVAKSGGAASPPNTSFYTRTLWASGVLILVLSVTVKYVVSWNEQFSYLLAWSVLVTFGGFALTLYAIPRTKHKFPPCLQGRDLAKKGTKLENTPVPEGLGIISGGCFLVCLILSQLFYAYYDVSKTSGQEQVVGTMLITEQNRRERLMEYDAALLSICFGLLLGFVDDVLDIPHKYKFILPALASLPLLVSYQGVTDIVVPKQVRSFIYNDGALTAVGSLVNLVVPIDQAAQGAIIKLGIFYHLYMLLLSVFCTNAINIYAGINGLEAGQAVIIGIAVIAMNVLELSYGYDPVVFTGNDDQHLMSLMIMLPFVGTTLALLAVNWYPSNVFVGDTFTHFAGMTFAVAAIIGHFSKTLLLLFVPQIINFLYSLPQLARIVPLPRHRIPTFNKETGLMEPSRLNDRKVITKPGGKNYVNMTVINLALQIFGPMREDTLCIVLLVFQALCCSLGLFIRYSFALYVY